MVRNPSGEIIYMHATGVSAVSVLVRITESDFDSL